MIKLVVRYLYVLVALVLVASCSSTRKLEKTPMIGGLTGEAYMEKVIELSPSWKTVSGKVALTLNMEGQKDAKVSATLRLKRGESIQLLVAPLLGIEVARLEITPGGLLAVDLGGTESLCRNQQFAAALGVDSVAALDHAVAHTIDQLLVSA